MNSLKLENNKLSERTAQFSAANARLKRELLKLTRHVNQLLESNDTTANRAVVTDIRKETEKSLMVRRLRDQVDSLTEMNAQKDHTIVQLRRQQGATAMMEMAAAKEEFFAEIQRLKKVNAEQAEESKAQIEWLQYQVRRSLPRAHTLTLTHPRTPGG